MSPLTMRANLERKPFLPLAVYSGDGSVIRIKSPEFALLSPKGRTLQVSTGERSEATAEEEVQVIDVFLITKLSYLRPDALLDSLIEERED